MRLIQPSVDIKCMTEQIIKSNGGQAYFNLTEVSRITGYGENTVPRMLYDMGALVKKDGKSKKVSALTIATLMSSRMTSPIG